MKEDSIYIFEQMRGDEHETGHHDELYAIRFKEYTKNNIKRVS